MNNKEILNSVFGFGAMSEFMTNGGYMNEIDNTDKIDDDELKKNNDNKGDNND